MSHGLIPFPAHIIARAARSRIPTTAKREPYAIERHPTIDGAVLIVGFDGRGDVMLEVRISASRFSEGMIEKMRRWLKAHDDRSAPLGLMP